MEGKEKKPETTTDKAESSSSKGSGCATFLLVMIAIGIWRWWVSDEAAPPPAPVAATNEVKQVRDYFREVLMISEWDERAAPAVTLKSEGISSNRVWQARAIVYDATLSETDARAITATLLRDKWNEADGFLLTVLRGHPDKSVPGVETYSDIYAFKAAKTKPVAVAIGLSGDQAPVVVLMEKR